MSLMSPEWLSGRFRILAGELRRAARQSLLLVLEARVAPPGALELVAHFHAQPAHALDLELDPVAVLERGQAAVVGTGREHVAGLERVDRADPLDAARDVVRHVAGVEVLLERA